MFLLLTVPIPDEEKKENFKIIFSLHPTILLLAEAYPANIYLFKVNNRNTTKRCEICSKLIKISERRQLTSFLSVSTVDLEQLNVNWVVCSDRLNIFNFLLNFHEVSFTHTSPVRPHVTKVK